MITIIHEKKGFYKHFINWHEGVNYMRRNGISFHFVEIVKDIEVTHSRFYRWVKVVKVS